MNLCAIKDCPNPGRPQICLYDGKYHHHGCIHYKEDHPWNNFKFRKDGWYWVCDEHYAIMKADREGWQKANLNR